MYIDLLIRIKNASLSGKGTVKVPHTKNDQTVAEILKRFGFLVSVDVKGRSFKKVMDLELNPERPIQGIKFLSRPSLRRYGKYVSFRRVKGGHGLLVVSTPKGIMTGEDARRSKVGGELLFEIW
ncbi:MAG TPA: 30S ribosomal protein S8 [Candidatus Paceibacterota bacterium]|nr:30S ribosomal protein S8 [Candidatus Paceibacterota bacterium]